MKKYVVKIGYFTVGFGNAKDAFTVWETLTKCVSMEQAYALDYQWYISNKLKPTLSVEDNVITEEEMEIMRKEKENAKECAPE